MTFRFPLSTNHALLYLFPRSPNLVSTFTFNEPSVNNLHEPCLIDKRIRGISYFSSFNICEHLPIWLRLSYGSSIAESRWLAIKRWVHLLAPLFFSLCLSVFLFPYHFVFSLTQLEHPSLIRTRLIIPFTCEEAISSSFSIFPRFSCR